MPRFFLAPEALTGTSVLLTGEEANHAKVLRLRIGDSITLCDGRGTDFSGVIDDVEPGQYAVRILGGEPSGSEPAVRCTIYIAFSKADKFEHVIQKATELGAAEIVGFPSVRCVSRPDERIAKKLERWQKIAAAAAGQSGRGCIPTVSVAGSYADALQHAAQAEFAILFYENERTISLRTALSGRTPKSVSLMTGPEGGFEPSEVVQAETAGLTVCSLGPRILRCETAPLCALSALLFATGQLE